VLGEGKERYDGWKVVRAIVTNEEQRYTVEGWGLDVWSRDSVLVLGINDIRVNDYHIEALRRINVSYEVLMEDVQKAIDREEQEIREADLSASWFTSYHPYLEIVAFLKNISVTYPTLTKFIPSIGKTIQGQDIVALALTGQSTNPKKNVLVVGGQHAREWIAPATVLYILDQLITDPSAAPLLDQAMIYFIPSANPDGYVYTWTSTRLWRKNRRANVGGSYGVDINRNWNDHWGGEGSSGTPTSETYRGTAPFSEPESTAISNFVIANGPFTATVDYHSYGQLIMRPYGWTNVPPTTDPILKTVGDTWRERVLAVNGVSYTSQNAYQLYYTSGGARDWYFSEGKVPYSFTVELRDTGTYGFELPAAQIIPTGDENYAGFLYYLGFVLAN